MHADEVSTDTISIVPWRDSGKFAQKSVEVACHAILTIV